MFMIFVAQNIAQNENQRARGRLKLNEMRN